MGDAGFSAVCYRCAVRVLGPLLLGWCAAWVPCPLSRCRALRVQPGLAGPGGFLLLGQDTEWVPPFSCSPGWRLSPGPILDDAVCASAYRAKMCKPVRAVIAGPLFSLQERRGGGLQESGRYSRREVRGQLSPSYSSHVARCMIDDVIVVCQGRDVGSPGAGNFDFSSRSFPGGGLCRSMVVVCEWFPGMP